MSKDNFLGKVDSDINVLDELNKTYDFCPNSNTIRPSEEKKEKKIEKIIQIKYDWYNIKDFISHTVFGLNFYEYIEDEGLVKKYVKYSDEINKKYVFIEQFFPYDVKGNHWVMWYPTRYQMKSDDEISEDIFLELSCIVKSNKFNFCWYINPTMTIPDFFHVQVFWDFI